MVGWIGAAIAATALQYSIYSGEKAANKGSEMRRRTIKSQDEALRIQMIERQRSAAADVNSKRAAPGSTVMADQAALGATDKTGGADDRLKLSRPSKLGGGS